MILFQPALNYIKKAKKIAFFYTIFLNRAIINEMEEINNEEIF